MPATRAGSRKPVMKTELAALAWSIRASSLARSSPSPMSYQPHCRHLDSDLQIGVEYQVQPLTLFKRPQLARTGPGAAWRHGSG